MPQRLNPLFQIYIDVPSRYLNPLQSRTPIRGFEENHTLIQQIAPKAYKSRTYEQKKTPTFIIKGHSDAIKIEK